MIDFLCVSVTDWLPLCHVPGHVTTQGKYFYLTPGICPSLSTMKSIVESAGGKLLAKQPTYRKMVEHKQNKVLQQRQLLNASSPHSWRTCVCFIKSGNSGKTRSNCFLSATETIWAVVAGPSRDHRDLLRERPSPLQRVLLQEHWYGSYYGMPAR